MKNLETPSREETRESVEPAFTSSTSEQSRSNQQPEFSIVLPSAESWITRDGYRMSPLAEW
ncbi:MAG: hypothetical protein JWO95_1379 [Verrucomicrobiales bacterium]|nr:hypothetical protein [Verrucomicrobiales bacterium]